MDGLHSCCAGLDVHKRTLVATVRLGDQGELGWAQTESPGGCDLGRVAGLGGGIGCETAGAFSRVDDRAHSASTQPSQNPKMDGRPKKLTRRV